MKLSLLYRGPLRSCDLACSYCPLDTRPHAAEELDADRRALRRLIDWIRERDDLQLSLLITPWGEALVHPHVQHGLIELSQLPQVERLAIQTNLGGELAWIEDADASTLALWVSFHPHAMSTAELRKRCDRLTRAGIRHSVGLVGLREHLSVAERLRAELPVETYLWFNAYKDGGADYYSTDEIAAFTAIDPRFGDSLRPHASSGASCRTGASVLSIDGEGKVRRCHFVDEVLGNLYTDPLESLLAERPCPQPSCGCHIGYVHLDRLGLGEIYGEGLLERIPRPQARVTGSQQRAGAPVANRDPAGYSPQAPAADHPATEDPT